MGRRASPGRGEDQTRQAVPLPSRSAVMTEERLSTGGNWRRLTRLAPAVAGLVEVETHAIAAQVDDVVSARAVDIGQTNALLVELVG